MGHCNIYISIYAVLYTIRSKYYYIEMYKNI
jgi:hypothetical protein